MARRMPEQRGVVLAVRRAGDPHDRVVDAGVVGHVDEVARLGQLRGAGDGVAVDLGDDRFGEVPDIEPVLGDVPGPCAVAGRGVERRLGHEVAAEVVAGREAGAPAADDGDAHIGIEVVGLEGGEQLGAHRRRDGVALLRPVQGDAGDVLERVIDDDRLVGAHDVRLRGVTDAGEVGDQFESLDAVGAHDQAGEPARHHRSPRSRASASRCRRGRPPRCTRRARPPPLPPCGRRATAPGCGPPPRGSPDGPWPSGGSCAWPSPCRPRTWR